MSWTTLPISEATVRAYLDVDGTTRTYSDAQIGSNIHAAAVFLERATGRFFEKRDGITVTLTTNGAASIPIPDTRSITSISLQGATLDVNESYWAIPDPSGAFTTIQFRAYGTRGASYLGNPQWFDRNLDRDWGRYGPTSSLPNDFVAVLDVGYDPLPADFLHAVKVLASWYTRRPASVLADTQITPEGNVLQYGNLPPEVTAFIQAWKVGPMLVAV